MDMKKILQSMDGISTKPVEGADSMAKFLRVVKEAEINQPAVKPVKVPEIPQLPAQDGDQGDGSRVTTNTDGTKTYAGAFGSFVYNAQGKAIKYTTPQFTGASQTIDLTNNQTTQNYNTGPMNTTQTVDANGNVVSHNTEYDLGVGKMAMGQDAKGIKSKEYTPADGEQSIASKDMYALGNKDKEDTYNRAMSQVNSAPVQENNLSKFLAIVDKNNSGLLSEAIGDPANVLDQVNSYIQFSSGLYQKSMSSIEIKKGLVLPITFKPLPPSGDSAKLIQANINSANARLPRELQLSTDQLSDIVGGADKPYAGPTLSEGANPHKVALPVQMAMQHYQQPKTKTQPRERLIDKYFVEAETEIMQRKKEKRALINQYAKTIAERVLMKESIQVVSETPIEMTGDPNDPHIYGHEKANPMSLKGRIAQARAQLKELAELAESDSLLAWEEICKKAKGGMFMGLEQNLEQIRHGISELAAKRRKGGVASRGIHPSIGEGKPK